MASLVKHYSDVTGKWERCTDTSGRCPYTRHRPDTKALDAALDNLPAFYEDVSDTALAQFMGKPVPVGPDPKFFPISKSNRGTSTFHAMRHKLEGHIREDVVAKMLPAGQVLGGTIKADISYIDENGKLVYASVKGGSKWQLMLYGKNRLTETETGKNDGDFINGKNADMSGFLTKEIDCFPEDWSTYEADKKEVKELLSKMGQEDVDKALKGKNNSYVSSKNKLQQVTSEFATSLQDKKNLRRFLEKAMFDNDSCQKFIVVKNHKVYTFDKKYVLDTLTKSFTAETSNAGRRKDDYNVDGQKVVLKADFQSRPSKAAPEGRTVSNNVLEVEIRNDSAQHYREVRLNLIGAKAFSLLSKKLADGSLPYTVQDIPTKKQTPATK